MKRGALIGVALALLSSPAAATPFPIPHPIVQADPYREDYPVVAAGPSGDLVLWRTGRGDTARMLYAARVDPAGVVLDPLGLSLASAEVPDLSGYDPDYLRLAAAWTGDYYLVVWDAGSGRTSVSARTVAVDGSLGPEMVLAGSGSGAGKLRSVALACGRTECMAAWWSFESAVGHRVRLARIVGDKVVATNLPATTAVSDQHQPAISWDGSNYLVVWRDIRSPGGGDLYAARVSPEGTVLDGTGFVVSQGTGTEDQPAAVWNGKHHLVVWRDDRSGKTVLRAARVTSDGVTLDPDGTEIVGTEGGRYPALAWNGVEHLMTWSTADPTSATRADATYATRLDAVGGAGASVTVVSNRAFPGPASLPMETSSTSLGHGM